MANIAQLASNADLFKNKWLSDVLLEVHGKDGDVAEFPAHRTVLVTKSAYFKKMFQEEGFMEAEEKVVQLKEVDLKYFEMALKWMYTEEEDEDDREKDTLTEVLEDSILLHRVADFYIIPDLVQHCVDRFHHDATNYLDLDTRSEEFQDALLAAADTYYEMNAEGDSKLGRCVVKLAQKAVWTQDRVGGLQDMLKKHPLFALDFALETTRQNAV
ncbi:POZ domain-containing protein [Mytilinidion resinicola]|uniref:POZ domain-containing protein n=1 Tax=Mytilinidion resinicola TaxID=574789 RepID=A0A6A6ZC63_9PEZI|nr:POZ domain-containing protein [Mytilinidion resinicola]KAF2817817.1 POZ domain-containing protein [Mytilinidion resinicola]